MGMLNFPTKNYEQSDLRNWTAWWLSGNNCSNMYCLQEKKFPKKLRLPSVPQSGILLRLTL
jgi:hypothetical protein